MTSSQKTRSIPVKPIPDVFNGRHQDLYELRCSSLDGLPPHARATAVYETFKILRKERPWASLLVRVYGPGAWYFRELQQHFLDCRLPICLVQAGSESSRIKYYEPPHLLPTRPKKPEFDTPLFDENEVAASELKKLRFLRPLARMEFATTSQIASMAGFGETQTLKTLHQLEKDGFIKLHKHGIEGKVEYAVWEIAQRGILHTNWSWNIPRGVKFSHTREEQRYSGFHHHNGSRTFPERLRKAYGDDFEIWQAWTEFPISGARSYPDTLVWGSYQGIETIVWLEFETAHKSKEEAVADILERFRRAQNAALTQDVQLIFVVITKLWLIEKLQELGLFSIHANTALIIEYSENPDCLAAPLFGDFNSVIRSCNFKRILNLSRILQIDPDYLLPKLRAEILDAMCSESWSINGLSIK